MINNLNDQLSRDEGRKKHVYKDSKGYFTIGIGILVDDRFIHAGLREKEIDFIFQNRLFEVKEEINRKFPWVFALDEIRQAVLYNMAFQLGVQGLAGFPKFLTYLKNNMWLLASQEMLDSKWAREDSPARAKRLSQQILTGEWQ